MQIDQKYIIREKDRHGNVRLYYRKKPGPRVRLREKPGTAAFARELLAAQTAEMKPGAGRPQREKAEKGSLRDLIVAYMKSPEYGQLDDRTQRVRRQILDRLCEAKPKDRQGVPAFGLWPVARMQPRHIREIRDDNADRPEAANGILKALRQVFAYGIEADIRYVKGNPAREVQYLKSKGDGHHAWTIEEVEQYERVHAVGTMARLALALLLYTGQRRSDVVRFGPAMVKDNWLVFRQHKNRNSKPVDMAIPMVGPLREIIDGTPDAGDPWIRNEFGGPYGPDSFGNWFRDRCIEAGVPGRAHGLRKAAASRLAEIGCSDRQIMSITGHTTSKEIDRYTRSARQRVLAASAMDMLTGTPAKPHLKLVSGE
ncbi:tyrosine-type recombinase/integrase [Pararhizobium haloflavum]|uniref:tyrosine-type recombinase/integrase n=1 Tax=Pararhizobium haloflavum TaxID=2037914 RepID=UPI001FE047A5|nr:tyrosine-type recombinase/integrase [Pararhizobium haloflavum]